MTSGREPRHAGRDLRSLLRENAALRTEEQSRIKAWILETSPVTATAISGGIAHGFAERMEGLGPIRAMSEHPRLGPHIDRLRAISCTRVNHRQDNPILVVLSGRDL